MLFRLRRHIQREFTRLAPVYTRLAAHRAQREIRELVAWTRPRRTEQALDAACGPGLLARALSARAGLVVGLDVCAQMIHAARQAHLASSGHSRILFAVGDVEQLPFPDRSFHLLTCTNSFANFPDPLRVLREFARVTRTGGRIAVVDIVAPENNAGFSFLNRLEGLRGRCYTRILKCSEFLDLFRAAGLHVGSFRIRRCRQTFRQWLHLSPAASNPARAQLLRRMFYDSLQGDPAGLQPCRIGGQIAFEHRKAWFLALQK